jgi:dienelactone hydrolase
MCLFQMMKIANTRALSGIVFIFLLAIPLLGCNADSMGSQVSPEPMIEINPASALFDEIISIHLSGFSPGDFVTVRANMRISAGSKYESWASFRTDDNGQIDLSAQKPIDGTYDDIDAMGLFWSMEEHKDIDIEFTPGDISEPQIITFTVEVDGNTVVSKQVERLIMLPDVTRIPVRENGLVGTLFLPSTKSKTPVVIVLGGSDGGLLEGRAAILASHGYAAFALAYFGAESLPSNLTEIPLEYFEKAIVWLQKQDEVDADKLGVMGASRGGELALLLGATFPEIKAVVAFAPSGLVWEGISTWETSQSAWSYQGVPLSFIPLVITPEFQEYVNEQTAYGKPIAYTQLFLLNMEDKSIVEEAIIPVENINGPILLISGSDDQTWPSGLFSEMIMERLDQNSHSFPNEHLSYHGAGHGIGVPYRPTTISQVYLPYFGEYIALGGNAADNAFAYADSWPKVLDFLNAHLLNGFE